MTGEPLGRRIGISGHLSALILSLFVLFLFWSKYGAVLLTAGALVVEIPGLLAGLEGFAILAQAQQEFSAHQNLILWGCAGLVLMQIHDFLWAFLRQGQFRQLSWWPLLLRPYVGLSTSTVILALAAFIASQQVWAPPAQALGLILVTAKLAIELRLRDLNPAIGAATKAHNSAPAPT